MDASRVEVQKWLAIEREATIAKRDAGFVAEAETHKAKELEEKKVTIRQWQKARRRDARDKILAALADSSIQ